MYLLDTNIVSVFDPRRAGLVPDFVQWMKRNGGNLHLSVITLIELKSGTLRLRREGKNARADELDRVIEAVLGDFAERVLVVDVKAALQASLIADAIRPFNLELADLLIAATARVHGLTVLTRNLRHFVPTGVPALDPLAGLPPDGR